MKRLIHHVIIIMFCLLLSEPFVGQTISLGADTSKVIMHDSTGYVEIHPLDIPDDRGLFVYSNDGTKALRIFGSFRMLFVMDDRQQFQPFHIDPPMLPTGADDFQDLNTTWTPNMSRIGMDALVGSNKDRGIMVRFELDWKGVDEAFRIRHMFMRTRHFIVGKTWTSFNALPYLPQTVCGHMTGAASGSRVPQIRYYNSKGNWRYQFSVEYQLASLIKPDSLEAMSRVYYPGLVGRFSYSGDWGQVGAAAILKPNRVKFTGDTKKTQTLMGYGANVGLKAIFKETNRVLFAAFAGSGMGSYIVDYSLTEIELIYNARTTEFENMNLFGGFLAYEHDWSKTFTSTFTGSYNSAQNKSYQEDLAFNYSYKLIVNLFYKPLKKLKGLVAGFEVLHTARFNKDNSSNNAVRFGLLFYYDF
jgi:hypothetical protein